MKVVKIPFDTKREEKIFGGYLSLRQVLYIGFCGLSMLLLLSPMPIIFKILVLGILTPFFLMCAFAKYKTYNFDKFFYYYIQYKIRNKKYYFERGA